MTKVKATKVGDYTPNPENANEHTERGMDLLRTSVEKTGLGRSIVVDKNGVLLAGEGTQETAIDLGLEDALEIETDGTRLVVVRRTDLDVSDGGEAGQKARLYGILDNRTAELGLKWKPGALKVLQLDDPGAVNPAFTPNELQAIVGKAETYFDPSALPDAPQTGAVKQTFLMYISFSEQTNILRAMAALTFGERDTMTPGSTIVALDGDKLLEAWEAKWGKGESDGLGE